MTAAQLLPSQPALANPVHQASPQSSDSTAAAQKDATGVNIELLTETLGVGFNSYLRSLYSLVRTKWRAALPSSVEKGDKRVVSIQFRVLQDGKVADDSLKVLSSSGKSEFDNTGLNAIRVAAPFDHLPSKFSRPFIELRMTFYYNVAPPATQ
jgi:TonB family protein